MILLKPLVVIEANNIVKKDTYSRNIAQYTLYYHDNQVELLHFIYCLLVLFYYNFQSTFSIVCFVPSFVCLISFYFIFLFCHFFF